MIECYCKKAKRKDVKMQRDAIFIDKEQTLSVILPPEIDHHAAAPIREATDTRLFMLNPGLLIIDFSAVTFMDSSGIGYILGRAALCEELGCRVRLVGLSTSLMRIVRLSGIEKLKNLSISD